MQDVPKIVVKRLQSPAAESHPDADLLTAFAEHSLAGRERDNVVEHLARCGDCREVLALALPATEAVAGGRAGSAVRTGWFEWPVLRWGVVAAGILAVTSVGVLQFKQRERKTAATSLMARNHAADTDVPTFPSSRPTSQTTLPPVAAGKPMELRKKTAARAPSAPAGEQKDLSANAIYPQSNVFHGGAVAGASAGAAVGGPITGRAKSSRDFAWGPTPQNSAPAPTEKQNSVPLTTNESVAVSRNSEVVEVQSSAPPITTQTAAQSAAQDQLLQNEPDSRVGRAKPALAEASPANVVRAPAPDAYSALMKSPTPRWTISANGALQRSLDGGKTWLDVNIAVDTSMSLNLVGGSQSELVMAESRSQTKTITGTEPKIEKKIEKKTETKNDLDAKARYKAPSAAKSVDGAAPAVTPTIFRALSVSSNAAEVWAGGTGGALYHTMDGGNLWVRVLPSAAGIVLTGDIVSIQFPDPRNGTVTTSNAEVWATADDGQTWRKQQ